MFFYINITFFWGKRFALKPWGQGVQSSRLVEPAAASVSKESFACSLLRPRKLCGIQVIYVSFIAYL